MGLFVHIPPVRLPSNMNLTGSTVIDLAVWLFCFAYVLSMLGFVAYCATQIMRGRSHRG